MRPVRSRSFSPRAGALVTALLASTPRAADAAACCGSGYGVGRYLASSERAAVMIAMQGRETIGRWDREGAYRASPAGVHEREARGELDWQIRLGPRLQLGVSTPLVVTSKEAGDVASTGGGVGDVRAYGRLDLVREGALYLLPSVSVALSLSLPTGVSSRTSTDTLGADVTGVGAGEVRPTLLFEETFGEHVQASASASMGLRTAYRQRDGREVQLAPRWALSAAAGPRFANGLALTAGILHEREGEATVSGEASRGSGHYRTAALGAASYDLTSRWTAFLAIVVSVPAANFGAGERDLDDR